MALAQPAVGLWLGFWGLRQKLECDYKLDRTARTLRWCIILIGWVLASLPVGELRYLRAAGYLAGIAFLWWPNFAYHLMRLIRRQQTPDTGGQPQASHPDGGGNFTFLNLHDPRPPAASHRDPRGSR